MRFCSIKRCFCYEIWARECIHVLVGELQQRGIEQHFEPNPTTHLLETGGRLVLVNGSSSLYRKTHTVAVQMAGGEWMAACGDVYWLSQWCEWAKPVREWWKIDQSQKASVRSGPIRPVHNQLFVRLWNSVRQVLWVSEWQTNEIDKCMKKFNTWG